jgi:hypothetical protein
MAQTSRQYILRLQIIHGAQVMMITAFNVIAYASRPPMASDSQVLLYVVAGIVVAGTVASRLVFKSMVEKANQEKTLDNKLTKYLTAFIVRLALLEAPGFFAAVVVLITGNPAALLGTAGVLILFFMLRPTPALLKSELTLSPDEQRRIDDPNGIVTE